MVYTEMGIVSIDNGAEAEAKPQRLLILQNRERGLDQFGALLPVAVVTTHA